MDNQQQKTGNDISTLAEDARALIAATADVAGQKVSEARERLAAALEKGKQIYGHAHQQAFQDVKYADIVVHEHPYQAIGIALGIGALVGFISARRACSCNGD